MAIFESGIQGYLKMYYEVEVSFPIDKRGVIHTKCTFCPYLSANSRSCLLNKKPVFFPETEIGNECPLKPKEETKDV